MKLESPLMPIITMNILDSAGILMVISSIGPYNDLGDEGLDLCVKIGEI